MRLLYGDQCRSGPATACKRIIIGLAERQTNGAIPSMVKQKSGQYPDCLESQTVGAVCRRST